VFRLFAAALLLALSHPTAQAQTFFFGNDLSYVQEMEDCGVVYRENGQPKDPFLIFSEHNCNLVRLRLWHTPAWHDGLNAGKRYSDLADVRKSIARAKAAGMRVLLDFHLSDDWADPAKQVVPAAWAPVANNLPALTDSLYNYIFKTLDALDAAGLLPELVQIGNETNRGILLSAQQNATGWSLDWKRNSTLFNAALKAVRAVESKSGKKIKAALHVAGPKDVEWLLNGFWENGVRDFDVIGISYYWAWHKPTTIAQTGDLIAKLRAKYPGKSVMVFETGYIWTNQSNDAAANIISETHPDFSPTSPENQQKWLVALTQEVIDRGGAGVIYWEPAWVSSTCRTQWGQGSHQEHAAFFDFSNNLMPQGGIGWMRYPYKNLTPVTQPGSAVRLTLGRDSSGNRLWLKLEGAEWPSAGTVVVTDATGKTIVSQSLRDQTISGQNLWVNIPPSTPAGVWFVGIYTGAGVFASGKTGM
jgi:arabinogalactan endo-1,4-beta-galactosidase